MSVWMSSCVREDWETEIKHIMILYVKEKRNCALFQLTVLFCLLFIQLVFTLFIWVMPVYLLSILFMSISPEDQCNALLGAVYVCITANDCHFNLKALLGIYHRKFLDYITCHCSHKTCCFRFLLEWPYNAMSVIAGIRADDWQRFYLLTWGNYSHHSICYPVTRELAK